MRTVIFAVVVGSIVTARLLSQHAANEVDVLSTKLAQESTHNLETLVELRGSVYAVALSAARYLQSRAAGETSSAGLDASLDRMHQAADETVLLPVAGSELETRKAIQTSRRRLDAATRRSLQLVEAGRSGEAWQIFATEVGGAAAELLKTAETLAAGNVASSRAVMARMHAVRDRSVLYADALAGICIVLALAGAVLLERQSRAQRAFERAQGAAMAARVEEFEQFAGRVAHDIKNPLSTARMAAELTSMRTSEEPVRELTRRMIRGLSSADAIINGLLEFARSGAKPDPGARTSPAEVIGELEKDLVREAGNAGIRLHFEPAPAVLVACNTGVYLSLVGNLVRNAIKYMGRSAEPEVRVRVIDLGERVRTEIMDTGPGIPEEHMAVLFDPYFRGRAAGREGLGLGLATVRRLAEGHHGQVGVRSQVGKGSTFWFELPRAGSAAVHAAEEPDSADPVPVRH